MSFTSWEITDWLTTNNSNNAFKRTKVRIENPLKTVKVKLNNLVQLKLLDIAGTRPMAKGIGITPTYRFNEYGYLLAWIIASFDSKTSIKTICNEIYNLLCNIFTDNDDLYSTSTTIFISKFLKKWKEREVFEDILILFRETLSRIDYSIVEMSDLLRHLFLLDFKDIERRIIFGNLFDETINGLDIKTKKLVLYNLQLDIERKMKEIVKNRSYRGGQRGV